MSTYSSPVRPSLQDFLEVEPKDSLETDTYNSAAKKKTKQPKTRKSLLEFLSSDTARSEEKEFQVFSHALEEQPPNVSHPQHPQAKHRKHLKNNESDEKDEFHFSRKFSDEEIEDIRKKVSGASHSSTGNSPAQQTHARFDRTTPLKSQNENKYIKKKGPTPEEADQACRVIQIWWRKVRIRRTAGKAAMRRMMENKRYAMQNKLNSDRQRVCI